MSVIWKKNIAIFSVILISGFFTHTLAKEEINTKDGYYFITVEFIPEVLKVGRNKMKLLIFEEDSKKLLEKLKISVSVWMPMHEHGTPESAVIKEVGKGEYMVERLSFSMAGEWEIYITIENEKKDVAVFPVKVIERGMHMEKDMH